MQLCKNMIYAGSSTDFYGLDAATASAMGWQGICTLGTGDQRGMCVHATTAGKPLMGISKWPKTEESLLLKLVRERLVSDSVALLALARFSVVDEDAAPIRALIEQRAAEERVKEDAAAMARRAAKENTP